MLIKPQSGVTLIEIIISLAIISVGLFTLLTVRNDNIKQADCANALSRAELLAAAKIEELVLAIKRDGRLSRTSGDFDEKGNFSWEAEAVETEIPKAGKMWHLRMKVYYPSPGMGGEFEIDRLVTKSKKQKSRDER